LLSDFGAEVIKVERPEGSPTRRLAPLVGGEAPDNSGLFAYLNTNKKSVTLDVGSHAGTTMLDRLLAVADVVIDDHDETWRQRHGLTAQDVERKYPKAVLCTITPFGKEAPQEFANAKSINVFNASGWGYHTPSAPDPARPPLKGPGRFISDYEGALDAALCIVSSLYWRGRSGEGQSIDISQRDVLISRIDVVLGRMITGEVEPIDSRAAYDMGGPHGFFPCKDGFIYLTLINGQHWKGLKKLLGDPAWMAGFDDDWLEFKATPESVAKCRAHIGEWVRDEKKDDVAERAQKLNVPLVPVNDASDLHRSPQFTHRGFFQSLDHPVLGKALYPTVPYKLSATPTHLASAAPYLGQHTVEYSKSEGRAR
jgi:crotonobetainyl-CoA:carnitine CoA-transferase CaiB-like acyl-CoA transferase